MLKKSQPILNEDGVIPVLVLVAVVGLLAFLAISAFGNFNNGLFARLYNKAKSYASGPVSTPTPTPGPNTSFGQATKFARGVNYLFVPTNQGTGNHLHPNGAMTVETWLRLDQPVSATDNDYLIYKQASYRYPSGLTTSALYYLQYYQNKLTFLVNDTSKNMNFAVSGYYPAAQVGVWHHIAGVYDGTNVNLYVDGFKLPSQQLTPWTSYPLVDDSLDLDINFPNSGSLPFTMDEIRISDSARYKANFSRPVSPFSTDSSTLALYHLDGSLNGEPSLTLDSSGHNMMAHMSGNVQFVPSLTMPLPTNQFGSSAYFSSINSSAVAVNKSSGVGPFNQTTFESWVDLQSNTANVIGYPIISKSFIGGAAGQIAPYDLQILPNRTAQFIYTVFDSAQSRWEANSITSKGLVPVGLWTHLAVSYDGSTIRLYINGHLDTQFSQTGQIGGGSTGSVAVGTDPVNGYKFSGLLDEVRISSNARYTGNSFTLPKSQFSDTSDPNTIMLFHFNNEANDATGHYTTSGVGNLQFIQSAINTATP